MNYYVRMTDKCLSGWGPARGKRNVLVVICDTWDQANIIRTNAKKRSEMKRVKIMTKHPRNRAGILYTTKTFDEMHGPWVAAI